MPDKVHAVKRMIKLAAWLKRNYGGTMNQALKTVIPVKEKIRHKEKKSIRLLVSAQEALELSKEFERKHATAKARLIAALAENNVIESEELKTKYNISPQTIKSLEQAGLIETDTQTIYRNPVRLGEVSQKRLELNEEQSNLVNSFKNDYDNGQFDTYLVHGVTGSGKTLCYIEMIEHVVNSGRQVIVLIPEIALTFQTVQRFYERFGDKQRRIQAYR